jgi:hypothetical protein
MGAFEGLSDSDSDTDMAGGDAGGAGTAGDADAAELAVRAAELLFGAVPPAAQGAV